MKYKEYDTIFITLSVILLVFGIFYGIWFFNLKNTSKNTNTSLETEITSEDIKDKDVLYKVKEIDINAESYNLLANKYIEKVNSDGRYSYINISSKTVIDNTNMLNVGNDKNLYDVVYDDNTLTISYVNKGELVNIYSIHKEANFFSKVYCYSKDNYYLIGFVLTDENTDYLYYINDKKVKEIELKDYYFLGDYFYDDNNFIVTHDPKNIVISSSGHSSNDNPKVFNIEEEKIILDSKYEDIISIGNSMFIVNKNNKATIVNSDDRSITIPYDFIDKVGDYYLVCRDDKIAVLDKNKKAISDFVIPYNGNEHDYHNFYITNYDAFMYKNTLVVIPYDTSKESSELYFLNSENKLSKVVDNNFYFKDFIYSYDSISNSFNIYDDSFNLLFIIKINDYFMGMPYYELEIERLGDTIALSKDDKKYYFDYKTGDEVEELKEYEIKFTNSIKLVFKDNKFTVHINDEIYDGYEYSGDRKDVFKKIGDNYYIFGDNKYMVITKG